MPKHNIGSSANVISTTTIYRNGMMRRKKHIQKKTYHKMKSPHALVLPYPAQGHVIPFMELSHYLVDCGYKITFVNTEFNHYRVKNALNNSGESFDQINLIAIPDGMGPKEDRNDLGRLTESILTSMPGYLEEVIQDSYKNGNERITCFIADVNMAFTLEVANKLGLRCAAFWPACAALLATLFGIPKLIEDGIIDEDGNSKKQEMISLSPGMPAMNTAHFAWNCIGDSKTQEIVYNYILRNNKASSLAEFIICNSFQNIESSVFAHAPNIIPVGPLLTGRRIQKPIGHFWPEDTSCMTWLDKQPINSVVYVAFGSFTIFNQHQFQELAHGLELTGRPFLWVVRPDLTENTNVMYPDGFRERTVARGKLVGWSPQQKVLAHPSVACFLTHCGWNSTMEGVTNGVPFLTWPYFADQFLNERYIFDLWKVGLKISPDENGFISRTEVKSKVEELLEDESFTNRATVLKDMAGECVGKGGSSYENLHSFAEVMKG